jgi:hypothetical protein
MVRRGLAVAAASLATCALAATAAGASTVVGPPLADPHLGVPLAAPPPPLLEGARPDFVQYRWERCRHYGLLVGLDRPTGVWHLDEGVADGAITGFVNGARRFDGVDDWLALSNEPDISGTRPYTMELWVRPSWIDDRYRFPISRETRDAHGRQGTGVWVSRRGVGFERWTNGVKAGVTFAAGIAARKWVGITATYDGARMRLFVSGALIGSRETTAPLASSAGPFRLGAGSRTDGNFGFFAGDLDEVALYDRALTRSHVASHGWAGLTAPCVQIPNADRSTYTPALEELGATMRSITNSTRSFPSGPVTVTSISESFAPTDDAGQLVRPWILTPSEGETVSGIAFLTAAVAGMPAMIDRIEFVVDGVVRYAKTETPFQYAWDTTAAANGVHTVAVRVWGPGSETPATAQHSVTVAN